MTDILRIDSDEKALVALGVLFLACFALAPLRGPPYGAHSGRGVDALASRHPGPARCRPLLRDAGIVRLDIWPINARFALLAVFLLPSLPAPGHLPGFLVFSAVAALGYYQTALVSEAFTRFEEKEEVLDADHAFEAIPEGSRVAGLIFGASSRHVKLAPFLHSVALLQSRKGGAAMFTFADFPQSPVRFREGHRPPPVPPDGSGRPSG